MSEELRNAKPDLDAFWMKDDAIENCLQELLFLGGGAGCPSCSSSGSLGKNRAVDSCVIFCYILRERGEQILWRAQQIENSVGGCGF